MSSSRNATLLTANPDLWRLSGWEEEAEEEEEEEGDVKEMKSDLSLNTSEFPRVRFVVEVETGSGKERKAFPP